jgi:acyl carrier protein
MTGPRTSSIEEGKVCHICSVSNGNRAGHIMMSVRATIISQFERVAREQDKTLAPLSDDLALLDTGLDSLCFAIIVARLEDILGFDPFNATEDVDFPVTLGDFIRFYENGAK